MWNPVAKYAVFLYEATADDLSLPRRYASELHASEAFAQHHHEQPMRQPTEEGGGEAWSGSAEDGEGAMGELAELAMIRWVPLRTLMDPVRTLLGFEQPV